MRVFQSVLVVAMVVLAPAWALAANHNQEMADQVKSTLKNSGKLSDYKIAVKVQDGTVWLSGQVRNEEQKATALKLAFANEGVDRVVNNLNVAAAAPAKAIEVAQNASAPVDGVKTASAEEPVMPEPPANFTANAAMNTRLAAPRQLPAQPMRGPMPVAYGQNVQQTQAVAGAPLPMYTNAPANAAAPVRYDQPHMPCYSWPSYAAYPNYAAVTYPKQYSPTAWPYIGPFYPYPQVPLGWRKVTLEWDDGWWMLDFKDSPSCCRSPIGRWY